MKRRFTFAANRNNADGFSFSNYQLGAQLWILIKVDNGHYQFCEHSLKCVDI